MAERLQLNDETLWLLAWEGLRRANAFGAEGAFFPIPSFQIPILFESPVLAISAENQDARSWWRLGVRVRQLLSVAGIDEIGTYQKAVLLNRGGTLVKFPSYAAQYRLEVEVPHWHREIKLTIWEYQGPITDTTDLLVQEQIDLVRVDLLRIENRINNP